MFFLTIKQPSGVLDDLAEHLKRGVPKLSPVSTEAQLDKAVFLLPCVRSVAHRLQILKEHCVLSLVSVVKASLALFLFVLDKHVSFAFDEHFNDFLSIIEGGDVNWCVTHLVALVDVYFASVDQNVNYLDQVVLRCIV